MTVADLVRKVKRRAGVGRESTTTDKVTADIIDSLNDRQFEFWRFWNWWFGIIEDKIVQPANDPDITLNVAIGDILAIDPGLGDYLTEKSLKQYLRFRKPRGVSEAQNTGSVTSYVKLGRDDLTGAFNIRLIRTPSSPLNMTIFGKKRISKFTVADIAAGTLIGFFPEEAQPILLEGVYADMFQILGKRALAEAKDEKFETKMRGLANEQGMQADEEATTPPPDYGRIVRARRGQGRGVA